MVTTILYSRFPSSFYTMGGLAGLYFEVMGLLEPVRNSNLADDSVFATCCGRSMLGCFPSRRVVGSTGHENGTEITGETEESLYHNDRIVQT